MSIPSEPKFNDFDLLWNFSQPAETQKKFEELLPSIQNENHPDRLLQLKTQIVRTLGLQRKFDEAHQALDQIEKDLNAKTPIAEIRYYLERGRVYNSSKNKSEALKFFQKAFDLSISRNQDNFAVDSAHMMGIAESNSEKQLEWNLKAMAIAEKSSEEKAKNWLGTLYNNMGWTYHDSGQFDLALEVFKKALQFRESKAEKKTIKIAKWAVARTLRSMKKYDEALQIQNSLEAQNQADNAVDGYVFEELAELTLAISEANAKTDQAQKYFALAYAELSKDDWMMKNETARMERMKKLGRVP